MRAIAKRMAQSFDDQVAFDVIHAPADQGGDPAARPGPRRMTGVPLIGRCEFDIARGDFGAGRQQDRAGG